MTLRAAAFLLPLALQPLAAPLWAQPAAGPVRQKALPGLRRPAAPVKPHPMLERFRAMTPEQRRRALEQLPPDRREAMRKRLEEWERTDPEERRRMQQQLNEFQNLPPDQQNRARRVFRQFQLQPPERRALLREELDAMRPLSLDERRGRMNTAAFKEKFSLVERRILLEFSDLFPPEP